MKTCVRFGSDFLIVDVGKNLFHLFWLYKIVIIGMKRVRITITIFLIKLIKVHTLKHVTTSMVLV